MAEKIRKINTESMQDMDDFIIEQLRESPELIPDLLKKSIQDLTAEEDNFKSVMKTLYYITRAREGGVSELSRKTGLTRQALYRLFKNGNPTLKTLVSVLNGLGVRLDVHVQ